MKRNRESERSRTSASPVAGPAEPILEAVGASQPLTTDEVLAKLRQLELCTPREAVAMIRKDRDGP